MSDCFFTSFSLFCQFEIAHIYFFLLQNISIINYIPARKEDTFVFHNNIS